MTTMKNILIASAALALSAGAAVAETAKAEIPFAFRIVGGTLPAGEYQIYQDHAGAGSLRFYNTAEKNKMALVPTPIRISAPLNRKNDDARLLFRCKGDDCVLAEVWMGFGAAGVQTGVPKPKPSASSEERVAVVMMHVAGGE